MEHLRPTVTGQVSQGGPDVGLEGLGSLSCSLQWPPRCLQEAHEEGKETAAPPQQFHRRSPSREVDLNETGKTF